MVEFPSFEGIQSRVEASLCGSGWSLGVLVQEYPVLRKACVEALLQSLQSLQAPPGGLLIASTLQVILQGAAPQHPAFLRLWQGMAPVTLGELLHSPLLQGAIKEGLLQHSPRGNTKSLVTDTAALLSPKEFGHLSSFSFPSILPFQDADPLSAVSSAVARPMLGFKMPKFAMSRAVLLDHVTSHAVQHQGCPLLSQLRMNYKYTHQGNTPLRFIDVIYTLICENQHKTAIDCAVDILHSWSIEGVLDTSISLEGLAKLFTLVEKSNTLKFHSDSPPGKGKEKSNMLRYPFFLFSLDKIYQLMVSLLCSCSVLAVPQHTHPAFSNNLELTLQNILVFVSKIDCEPSKKVMRPVVSLHSSEFHHMWNRQGHNTTPLYIAEEAFDAIVLHHPNSLIVVVQYLLELLADTGQNHFDTWWSFPKFYLSKQVFSMLNPANECVGEKEQSDILNIIANHTPGELIVQIVSMATEALFSTLCSQELVLNPLKHNHPHLRRLLNVFEQRSENSCLHQLVLDDMVQRASEPSRFSFLVMNSALNLANWLTFVDSQFLGLHFLYQDWLTANSRFILPIIDAMQRRLVDEPPHIHEIILPSLAKMEVDCLEKEQKSVLSQFVKQLRLVMSTKTNTVAQVFEHSMVQLFSESPDLFRENALQLLSSTAGQEQWKLFLCNLMCEGFHKHSHSFPQLLNHLVIWRMPECPVTEDSFTTLSAELQEYFQGYYSPTINKDLSPDSLGKKLQAPSEDFSMLKLEILLRNYLSTGVPNLMQLTSFLFRCGVGCTSAIRLNDLTDLLLSFEDWIVWDIFQMEYRQLLLMENASKQQLYSGLKLLLCFKNAHWDLVFDNEVCLKILHFHPEDTLIQLIEYLLHFVPSISTATLLPQRLNWLLTKKLNTTEIKKWNRLIRIYLVQSSYYGSNLRFSELVETGAPWEKRTWSNCIQIKPGFSPATPALVISPLLNSIVSSSGDHSYLLCPPFHRWLQWELSFATVHFSPCLIDYCSLILSQIFLKYEFQDNLEECLTQCFIVVVEFFHNSRDTKKRQIPTPIVWLFDLVQTKLDTNSKANSKFHWLLDLVAFLPSHLQKPEILAEAFEQFPHQSIIPCKDSRILSVSLDKLSMLLNLNECFRSPQVLAVFVRSLGPACCNQDHCNIVSRFLQKSPGATLGSAFWNPNDSWQQGLESYFHAAGFPQAAVLFSSLAKSFHKSTNTITEDQPTGEETIDRGNFLLVLDQQGECILKQQCGEKGVHQGPAPTKKRSLPIPIQEHNTKRPNTRRTKPDQFSTGLGKIPPPPSLLHKLDT